MEDSRLDALVESYRDELNEIWSYSEERFRIMKAHIEKREAMRPYIR